MHTAGWQWARQVKVIRPNMVQKPSLFEIQSFRVCFYFELAVPRKGTSSGNPELPAPPDRFRQSFAITSRPEVSMLDMRRFSVPPSRDLRALMLAFLTGPKPACAWLSDSLPRDFCVHETP